MLDHMVRLCLRRAEHWLENLPAMLFGYMIFVMLSWVGLSGKFNLNLIHCKNFPDMCGDSPIWR